MLDSHQWSIRVLGSETVWETTRVAVEEVETEEDWIHVSIHYRSYAEVAMAVKNFLHHHCVRKI